MYWQGHYMNLFLRGEQRSRLYSLNITVVSEHVTHAEHGRHCKRTKKDEDDYLSIRSVLRRHWCYVVEVLLEDNPVLWFTPLNIGHIFCICRHNQHSSLTSKTVVSTIFVWYALICLQSRQKNSSTPSLTPTIQFSGQCLFGACSYITT